MSLKIIIGPMCSGKTTCLLGILDGQIALGRKCLLVSHSSDKRNPGDISKFYTNSGIISLNGITHMRFSNVADIPSGFDVVGIDESQFFDDIVEVMTLIKGGTRVIVSGLSGDSNMERFGNTIDLIPKADSIIHLKALCVMCSKQTTGDVVAPFTKRIAKETSQKLIGGMESYMPTCRKCHS